MNLLTVEHPFFDKLRHEHRQIEHFLDLMLKNLECKDNVQWLWNNAELIHHFKEETILFNYLAEHYNVMSGGPLCMFFLDSYILYPPLEKCKQISGALPELEEHQKKIFELGSTMRVPINEHRAGKEILKFTLKNWNDMEVSKRNLNLKIYDEIQREHLNKEENCFFHLCVNLLNTEQADLLLTRWG